MKKVSLLILVSMILLLAFTSCDVLPESVAGPLNNVKDTVVDGFNNIKDKIEIAIGTHEHEWTAATCTDVKTCPVCGETEGEALGHDWSDATCTAPQTCKTCGETTGEALGHNWVAATCTAPKTCSRCDLTEGEAAGHDWQEATCTAPITCAECGETDGEPKGHTMSGPTCTEAETCTVCGAEGNPALGHDWTDATCLNPESVCTVCEAVNPVVEIVHNVKHVEALEATCHQNGNTEYWYCADCELVWTNEALTQQSNFKNVTVSYDVDNIAHVDKVEATCHQNGCEEYWYCLECDAVFADAALTQLTNRLNLTISYKAENVAHVDKVEATCHQNGCEEYWYCVECDAVFADAALTQLTNRLNLTISYDAENIAHVDKVEASCHQNGSEEYWYCVKCDAVFADAALTQLTNRLNLTIPYNSENIVHVPAKDANCTDTDGNHEYWYCAECDAVFTDAALKYLSNIKNVTIPSGHVWVDATCDAPKTCSRCNETEGEPLATHTIDSVVVDGKFFCKTCDATYTVDNKVVFTGDQSFVYNVNGAMPLEKVDGAYSAIFSPDVDTAPEAAGQGWAYNSNTKKLGAQPMYWIPTNSNSQGLEGFTCESGATGVISFTIKTSMTDPYTVAIAQGRDAAGFNWSTSSINLFTISGAADVEEVVLTNVYTSGFELAKVPVVDGWAEFTVDLFIALTAENKMTVAYYVNGQFCNAVTGDMTISSHDIRALYINGWTYTPGTGIVIDDIVFGSTTTSEWIFDEHVHVWADATCTEAKKCTICGTTEGSALGHTEVAHEAKAPTCTEIGWDEYVTCEVCDYTSYVEKAALGHDWADPKCDQPSTCNRCGESTGDVLGHEFKEDAYVSNNDAKCGVDGTETAKCSRCDATDTRTDEGSALEHVWSEANCAAPKTCTREGCGATEGDVNSVAHTVLKYVDGSYVCSSCNYAYVIKTGIYADGTNYNGMTVNDARNDTYFNVPDNSNYPDIVADEATGNKYYQFIRNAESAGSATQVQVWVPTAAGANQFAGFSSANHANGYFSFSVNANMDVAMEWKLVDASLPDCVDMNGDGVVTTTPRDASKNPDFIRWTDNWAINSPVFSMTKPADGKVTVKGFNGAVLAVREVDENNWSGWFDVAINLVLDPETDTVTAHYYIDGKYVTTQSRPLTTLSNAITGVYMNGQAGAEGAGYKFDNLAFGYTAHTHNLEVVEANGVITLECACGASYLVEDYREWNGDGSDSNKADVPNGNVELSVNEAGQYEYIFKPSTDTAPDFSADNDPNKPQSADGWCEYTNTTRAGGQLQMWMPSNYRDADTLADFSCENNAVGVISFSMKTNMTRHANQDTSLTFAVGKPRNATDWNGGLGSWNDDSINIFTVEDYLETGVVLKGGLNGANLNLATIPVADGWSEWFDVTISIEMLDTGVMNVYYYINGVYCGTDSRDLNNPGSNRTLDPKKIEALQISGWTFAPNTGVMFDDFVFGYTVGGHNTLDGQYHKLTETTCGEKSTCTCGWTGYTVAHDLVAATCGAPATCKVCGLTEGEALTHNKLSASVVNGVTVYNCSDCGKQYVADAHNLYYDGSTQIGAWSYNGDVFSKVTEDGYNHVYSKETDGTLFSSTGNQFMTWIPSQSTPAEFGNFTCANNAIGLASFKIKAYTDSSTGVEFKVNDGRGTDAWGAGPTANGWSDCSVGIFKILPVTSADATTVGITGLNGQSLTTVALAEGSKWTEWLDVAMLIKLSDDNKISVDYYINGAYVGNNSMDMPIYTNKISSFYINGYTKSDDTGYYLDDLSFGYTLNGLQTPAEPEAPLYTEVIDVADVTSETLKAIATDKIKQCDQTAPVYVKATKGDADVEALYFSHTTGWEASSGDNNYGFVENRWAVSANVTSISFDYLIKGTLNGESTSSDGTWIDGTVVPLGNSVVQLKSGSTLNGVSCDGYPELPDSSLTADGEWHTFTVTFDEPLDTISHFLVKLYNLDGEFLISNIKVTYAE